MWVLATGRENLPYCGCVDGAPFTVLQVRYKVLMYIDRGTFYKTVRFIKRTLFYIVVI